jgi:LysR family transcriptional regulator, regulatory protein for tcuABC
MELRQLRYLVRTIELGSISQAALDLGVAQSAISQQIQRLEGELATRLLQRTASGVIPTDAGLAFLAHAQLALRHAESAAAAAQHARLSGSVSVGLAPTTAGVLGFPLLAAMRAAYPDIRLHLVEGMSGHLAAMLNARDLDLAVLFDVAEGRRWSHTRLLEERLFLIQAVDAEGGEAPAIGLAQVAAMPLIIPTRRHGLRRSIDAAFQRLDIQPTIVAEIDSLYVLMDAVGQGLAATLQPWAALARQDTARLRWAEVEDPETRRGNELCSLSDDELSPAALATRVVLGRLPGELVAQGRWRGVTLPHLETR